VHRLFFFVIIENRRSIIALGGIFMNVNKYCLTSAEKWITDKYKQSGIHYVSDLDIDIIASIFNGMIKQTNSRSHVRWDDDVNFFVVFLNRRLSIEEKRVQFFHELAHPLLHVAKQNGLLHNLYVELQEIQANQFLHYAAIPYYLIESYLVAKPDVFEIAEDFKLPVWLVQQRLNQIHRRITGQEAYKKRTGSNKRKYQVELPPRKWSKETQRLLNQLEQQLNRKELVR
jgi:hypothetical protein